MKTIVLIGLVMVVSGCGTIGHVGGDYLTMTGTPEGWRAGQDLLAGLVAEGKASPNTISSRVQLRSQQEIEVTNRAAGKKSLMQMLFATKKDEVKK